MAQIGIAQTAITSKSPGSGGGAPTTDIYVLGAADATHLPNAVVNPTAAFGVDAAPASAGTLDDEFPGTSLSGSWTQVNSPTVRVANSILGLTAPANSGTKFFSILKAVPGTPWTVVAKCTLFVLDQLYNNCGIALADGTATTNKLIQFGLSTGIANVAGVAGEGVQISRFSNYTTFSVTSLAVAVPGKFYYLKVQDNGTNLIYSYSPDGVNFVQLFSESRTAFFAAGPTQVGLCIDAENTGTSAVLSCDWFRRTQ